MKFGTENLAPPCDKTVTEIQRRLPSLEVRCPHTRTASEIVPKGTDTVQVAPNELQTARTVPYGKRVQCVRLSEKKNNNRVHIFNGVWDHYYFRFKST